MIEQLIDGIVNLAGDQVLAEVKRGIESGENALEILEKCRKGMNIVGELFNKGDISTAELILSGELFRQAFLFLEPYLASGNKHGTSGKVILATMQGDIHDLGKNILATLLKSHGFEVYDLGVDVSPETLINEVRTFHPRFLGLSALITPVLKVMKRTVELLEENGLRKSVYILIGGGITTPQSRAFIGADFQSIEAMESLNYCIKMSRKEVKSR